MISFNLSSSVQSLAGTRAETHVISTDILIAIMVILHSGIGSSHCPLHHPFQKTVSLLFPKLLLPVPLPVRIRALLENDEGTI